MPSVVLLLVGDAAHPRGNIRPTAAQGWLHRAGRQVLPARRPAARAGPGGRRSITTPSATRGARRRVQLPGQEASRHPRQARGRHRPHRPLRAGLVLGAGPAAAASRAKKLDRAHQDLRPIRRPGRPPLPAPQPSCRAGGQRRRHPQVSAYLRAEARHRPNQRQARPCRGPSTRPPWTLRPPVDGWSRLVTNLTIQPAVAAEVLRRYKGQEVVERRYGSFKGPRGSPPCSSRPTAASQRWPA